MKNYEIKLPKFIPFKSFKKVVLDKNPFMENEVGKAYRTVYEISDKHIIIQDNANDGVRIDIHCLSIYEYLCAAYREENPITDDMDCEAWEDLFFSFWDPIEKEMQEFIPENHYVVNYTDEGGYWHRGIKVFNIMVTY